VKARDFFQDIFTTDLRQDEILTEVRVPVLPPRSGGTYVKLGRGGGGVRLWWAGVGSTPIRATKAEDVLKGQKPSDALVAEAGEKAAEMSNPSSDIRGSAEYKREMVKVHVRKAIKQSIS